MGVRSATISLDDRALRFIARTGSGHTMVLDDAIGDAGPRPAELLPMALAACTAMDVISIMRKKRQEVSHYAVECSGSQREDTVPHVFSEFVVTHIIEGRGVTEEALRRAIELSATRYCSVGSTLASGEVTILHRYVLRTSAGECAADVVTLGPDGQTEVMAWRELELAGV